MFFVGTQKSKGGFRWNFSKTSDENRKKIRKDPTIISSKLLQRKTSKSQKDPTKYTPPARELTPDSAGANPKGQNSHGLTPSDLISSNKFLTQKMVRT